MTHHFKANQQSTCMIVALAFLGVMAFDAQVYASNGASITFYNATAATIRIDPLTANGVDTELSSTVAPDGKSTIRTTIGEQLFDLVAFRANPSRIHRLKVDISEHEENDFLIHPVTMNVYLLEDAEKQDVHALPKVSTQESADQLSSPDIRKTCQQGSSVGGINHGYVLWNAHNNTAAQYYELRANLLCALDGMGVFRLGVTLESYDCKANWRQCRRNPKHDAKQLPPIRTANFSDDALRYATRGHPGAAFAQTQTLSWLRNGRLPDRLTQYLYFMPTDAEVETQRRAVDPVSAE